MLVSPVQTKLSAGTSLSYSSGTASTFFLVKTIPETGRSHLLKSCSLSVINMYAHFDDASISFFVDVVNVKFFSLTLGLVLLFNTLLMYYIVLIRLNLFNLIENKGSS